MKRSSLFLILIASAQAATITGYDFQASTLAATSGIYGSAITLGSGLTANYNTNNTNTFDANMNSSTADDVSLGGTRDAFGGNSGTLAAAITNNDYISFTVTPGANPLPLGSLNFVSQANSGTRSADEISIFSSVNGFTAADVIASTGTNRPLSQYNAFSFDLSGESDLTAPTEFRLYIYGGTTNSNNSSFAGFDNIVLSTPEPTSATLLGLGGLALLARRRRA